MSTALRREAAPPAAAVAGAAAANPWIDWLLAEGWHMTDPEALVRGLIDHMVARDLPLHRFRVTIRTLHPQVIGITYTWEKKTGALEVTTPSHDILSTPQYLDSPYAPIFEGAGAIRRRLDIPDLVLDFPILEDLHAEGATDYVAVPMLFSDGQINAITLAADRPGGFTGAELQDVYDMLPVLARIFEVHAMRRTARTILETYLGHNAGERVLEGRIRRGDGDDIHAVIWFCDLRGSTPLADSMSREAFLEVLNEFFECMAGAVLDAGGEVLRFIGDAVLAIFPIDSRTDFPEFCPEHMGACRRAVAAARDAMGRIDTLNTRRAEAGQPPLGYGIALHLGDVTYGNIGVPQRLEFTVVGAAANLAARLQDLCKVLDRSLLLSAEFARVLKEPWVPLGRHALRGVGDPVEVFTVAD